MRVPVIFLILTLSAASADAFGESITGPAVALDGDTLLVEDQRVRLFGIDAPEMSVWPWGPRSRAALDSILQNGRGVVDCAVVNTDQQNRPVAVCHVASDSEGGGGAEIDVAYTMVLAGWALPRRYFSYANRSTGCSWAEELPAGESPAVETPDEVARGGCLGPLYDLAERRARIRQVGVWARTPGN